jgi:hypothetical protein
MSRHTNTNRNEKANRINTLERCTEIITNLANLDRPIAGRLSSFHDEEDEQVFQSICAEHSAVTIGCGAHPMTASSDSQSLVAIFREGSMRLPVLCLHGKFVLTDRWRNL